MTASTTYLNVIDGQGNAQKLQVDTQVVNGNTVVTYQFSPTAFTLQGGTNYTVTTGGSPVIAITGPVKGGYITNPEYAADQGLSAAELLYIDPVYAPGDTGGSGNNTCVALDPGASWNLPCAIAAGQTVEVNAPSSGHKFIVVVWN